MKRPNQLETGNARLREAIADLTQDKLILQETASGHWQTPHAAPFASAVQRLLPVSECPVCAASGQHRPTKRRAPRDPGDEDALYADIIEFAR